jgi:hypothetical protein
MKWLQSQRGMDNVSNDPHWICFDCGAQYGRGLRPGGVSSVHDGKCEVSGDERPVTEPRDFGYLEPDWRERYVAYINRMRT